MPSWETFQAIGLGLGALGSGVWGGIKLAQSKQRHRETDSDAEVGRESATALVQRAEARMKEMHDLRDNLNQTLGAFSLRLLSVEKDFQRVDSTLIELKSDMKAGQATLNAILERVYSLPGGRRRQDDAKGRD